jgi:hypothetical protein
MAQNSLHPKSPGSINDPLVSEPWDEPEQHEVVSRALSQLVSSATQGEPAVRAP